MSQKTCELLLYSVREIKNLLVFFVTECYNALITKREVHGTGRIDNPASAYKNH